MHRFAPWHWLAPAVALCVMLFGAFTHHGEQGELRKLLQQGHARDVQPLTVASALHGKLHDRHANRFYCEAQKLASSLLVAINASDVDRPELWSSPTVDATRAELRSRWQPLLALIEEGAHSRQIATKPAWHVLGIQAIVKCECHLLLREQRQREAIHVWLDNATMATDALRTSRDPFQLSWSSNVLQQLGEFWTTKQLAALSDDNQQRLQQGVAALEARLTPGVDLERFLYTVAENVTGSPFRERYAAAGWQSRLRHWRDGFSPAQRIVREAEAVVRHLRDLVPAQPGWSDRQQQLAVLRFDPEWHAQVLDWERGHRRGVRALRQLQVLLLTQSGQPSDALQDPLGAGPLSVEQR